MRYGVDDDYNTAIKKFVALSFCSPADVQPRYNTLADNFLTNFGDNDVHQNFLQYFENTWVGRPRRNPLYPVEMWNCKGITERDLPRTNNSVESFHRVFQTALGCHHPNIFKLLDAVLREQVRVNAIYQRINAGEEVPLYSRIPYFQANQRLLRIIGNYDQRTADNFLAACSHYIYN